MQNKEERIKQAFDTLKSVVEITCKKLESSRDREVLRNAFSEVCLSLAEANKSEHNPIPESVQNAGEMTDEEGRIFEKFMNEFEMTFISGITMTHRRILA